MWMPARFLYLFRPSGSSLTPQPSHRLGTMSGCLWRTSVGLITCADRPTSRSAVLCSTGEPAPPSGRSGSAWSSPRLRSRSRAISQSEIRCASMAAARISFGSFSRALIHELTSGLVAEAQKDAGAERLQERPPRLGTAQHGLQRTDGLCGDDGDDAALAGERKGFLAAARVVLADAGEGLVFVADKDGRPDVAAGLGLHHRRPAQQRLEPRIFQHDADGAGQRIEGRQIDAFHGGRRERRGVGAGRVVRVAGRYVEPPRLGRGRAKQREPRTARRTC